MSAVLLETLVWTGVLIAAVLLVRRPVSRWFGPQMAYALWLIPAARLVLPPVTLPAWMAPAEAVPAARPAALLADAPPPADPAIWQAAMEAPAGAVHAPLTASAEAAPQPGFDLLAMLADWPWLDALLLAWVAGAGVFLYRRFAAYFELRDALLAEAREVGSTRGPLARVRLVETPATTAPLAFGVLDPVIALPPGFMALHDRQARDFALAHELAHHRGGDLLVNVLVQPLFALHWFNPLGRYGWLALRRDQEAACDARVMARRTAAERAAYATLIARFAANPGAASHAALSAPMACPVLGEKSIIHRLRSLSMSHISLRRRLAGSALLGAGLLALPLTASISYAASDIGIEAPEPPTPPEAPEPATPPEAPEAPEAPEPPEAPDANVEMMIFTSRGDAAAAAAAEAAGEDGERMHRVILRERAAARAEAAGEAAAEAGARAKERHVRIVRKFGRDGKPMAVDFPRPEGMSEEEHEEMLAGIREGLAEAERVRAELPQIIAEAMASADAAKAAADAAGQQRVIIKQECRPGSKEVSETTTGRDGSQVVSICKSRIFASARKGLEEARAEIARDKDIPEDTRKQVLKQLDQQIRRWKESEG